MTEIKQDNEVWFVHVLQKSVEMIAIPKKKSVAFKQEYLFDTYDEAEHCKNNLYKIYFETFRRKPLVRPEKLEPYYSKLVDIELTITERLSKYPSFNGIDFCDVTANGIQIRGHHKQVVGYCFGSQPTIRYDFSNYNECVEEFIEMWQSKDNLEYLRQFKSHLSEGERWGWK